MKEKPLIAHVLYRLDTGGMERIVVSLIKATQDRYRHAVIVLAGFGALRDEIEDAVVACLSLDKQPGKDWRCHVRFWRALKALQPDLVQTYNIGTLDLAPIVRLAGVRVLVHAEHGRDVTDPNGLIRKYHWLRRWMAPFIRRYVAVSRDLEQWLIHRVGIRSSKVLYIANGIDTAAFDVARSPGATRKLLGAFAPPDAVLVGNVARLDKVKDQAGLIAAFKLVRDTAGCPECRLFIAGDGPERDKLQRQIVQLGLSGSVQLLGNRSDVADLLSECDVFALSSVAEGMPITVLEAMAAGVPVVATHVGGVASVVDDGVTGTLVPPRDTRALAQALTAHVCDAGLRHQQGDAGRARVVQQFSLRAMTSAYVALYDELLGQKTCAMPTRALSGLTESKEH